MRLSPYLLALSILLPSSAMAQSGKPVDDVECRTGEAALVQEMDVAQARGRMLQRRQLAEQLAAIQARCGTLPPTQSREASIDRLQRDILEMRKELDRAETELRKLKQGL